MKVLVTEVMWEEGLVELKRLGFDVHYDPHLWDDRGALLSQVNDVDALIVRNQTKVDKELLEKAPELKVIGRLGVGLENIAVDDAKKRGIQTVVPRFANATSVAEYVMAAILMANRPLFLANEDVRKGNWDRKQHTGREIFHKVIGLVGLGEISHRVAKRAKAFGMNVIGYDPFLTSHDHIVAETSVQLKHTLEDVLSSADFISIHVPLTSSTKNLISESQLSSMKQSAYIINTSRGGIIDEEALYCALKEGTIAGAYLDVLESEPIDQMNPLLQLDNVIFSPHIAGLTTESQVRISLLVAQEVGKVLDGKASLCLV
ncbi:hydroxyacid dehydrogenase [Bacillus sp. FJAT-29937]|uniref:hydroxyacid dehydrogenase n=1 Tax=Bacillus sp. FJAT-29937 TaxID=1720553 RepID=UPI0008331A2A|nr:hydroxyacid dehydrogenase [Bacillus sp. FJAT-29937]